MPDSPLVREFGGGQVMAFLQSIEGAINQNVTPEQFALGMANQLPPVLVAKLMGFEPGEVISLTETMVNATGSGYDSAILREDGRKWIPAVWEAGRSLIRGGQPAPAAPSPGQAA